MERLEITSVIGRVAQTAGVLEPFICGAADGLVYYVKGRYAGAVERINELVAAELGRHIGLNIPRPVLLSVPREFIRHGARPDLNDLGEWLAFASTEVPNATVYLPGDPDVAPSHEDRRRLLLFDWWICNYDRCKAKPNLIVADKVIYVIDHNCAFSDKSDMEGFLEDHIYSDAFDLLGFNREINEPLLDSAMGEWGEIVRKIPDEWLEQCSDGQAHIDKIERILLRYKRDPDSFWRGVIQ